MPVSSAVTGPESDAGLFDRATRTMPTTTPGIRAIRVDSPPAAELSVFRHLDR